MPLQTFLNLPEERRKMILYVAFEEFALHEYKVASIGHIVKKLGIAKGSFYRYFENKKALYFYLLDYAGKLRFDMVDHLFANDEMDFFELIVENFAMKVRFDMENPLTSGFLYNVMQEKNNEEIGNIQLETKKKILNIVENLLLTQVRCHTIRTDIPLADMAYLIVQVQWGIYDYLEIKYGIDFRENVKQRKPVFTIPEEDILNDVRSFARLLKSGMQKSIL